MLENRWKAEEAWWTGSTAEARRHTHPAAIMVFAHAILQGPEIFASLERAPRWTAVTLTDRRATESEDCTVLAYLARARRADGGTYEARCSSTWVRQEAGWRLIQHQQTRPGGDSES
ncbi:DUF4440 domain-containing protein [Paracoccus sp. S-4012]|uniref:nuclear transport factor 2 family protein n=1 Tax=Paracoccus sp. S-4012 TaxID=2665648 RepID=UPI0012B14B34|nr:nuclear transport factor 2 family protein [Paracoccus sp. S-4012]MRX51774.1 DUF4440 domain-containing protein [Paracoccus sp. S-4012]